MAYKTDYIKIENRQQFLIDKLEDYHPDDPRHTPYWRALKKKCIEGMWGQEFGGYRYCTGQLFFYGNFFTIFDVDVDKQRIPIKPQIDDIEWERSYMLLEALGFSGWSDDDEYTSNHEWFELHEKGLPSTEEVANWNDQRRARYLLMINSKGELKKYRPPRENMRMLHKQPMGHPIYHNPCKNIMEFGSRGGGKSFWYASVCQHGLAFNGAKVYNDHTRLNRARAEICIGSGKADKSSDFMQKVVDSNEWLADHNGSYGQLGDPDYEPSPFYLDMAGSSAPNNKKNKWRHEYKVEERGRWIKKGTKSYIAHVVYSPTKKDGAESAAGGRYMYVIYEESGLTELLVEAWGSNVGTVRAGGFDQVGVQIALGTSGNMEVVGPSRDVFTHPEQFNLVSFVDEWENGGQVGFFLPNYMTNRRYKDKNGNTDYKKVIELYEKDLALQKKASNPKVLRSFRMNYPNKISDMWQRDQGNILPAAEAEDRIRELMLDNEYERIGTPVTLKWSTTVKHGVTHEVDFENVTKFYEPKQRYEKDSLEGGVVIYDFPKDNVPTDYYQFMGHDPYAGDDQTDGDSLGVCYLVTNPKYTMHGLPGNTIVAAYIGRSAKGKDYYYDTVHKLLCFYNCPPRTLWYEADRGEAVKDFFVRKKVSTFLALRPTKTRGEDVLVRAVAKYGYKVGTIHNKITLLTYLADWLLAKTSFGGVEKMNIERIPCIWLLRQIVDFNLGGNFDGVMAMLGVVLGIMEQAHQLEAMEAKKNQPNPLGFLSGNPNLFSDVQNNGKTNQRVNNGSQPLAGWNI